jgi:hypothetical protein
MPALLYGIGAFALFAGLLMIGFGIPINEFSFGNTLIGAGTTASVGGLIIIGLGVIAGQLRRVAETMAMLPGRPASGPEALENAVAPPRPAPAQGRAPFPARQTSPAFDPMPGPAANPFEERLEEAAAPTLRNPDISEALEEEFSLSPPRPAAPPVKPPANDLTAFGRPAPVPPAAVAASAAEKREPMAGWRSPPSAPPAPPLRPGHGANFDAMWPAEAKPKGPVAREPQPDAKVETISRDPKRGEPDAQRPRSVAVLKSGVVDGMAYTLYVDGSIEAELPQGTVRFASIHELRNHLAKNS